MKFYQWYTAKVKQSPAVIVLGTLITIFAAIGSFYGGLQAINEAKEALNEEFFENRVLYKELEKINTGLSVDYVESEFGPSIITKDLPEEFVTPNKPSNGEIEIERRQSGVSKYRERIYIHPKYFLRLISDDNEVIVAYSITIRKKDFNPPIPLETYRGDGKEIYPYISDLKLGRMELSQLEGYSPEKVNIGNWGMHNFYIEANYFGNPGYYKHYLFELSDSGIRVGGNTLNLEILNMFEDSQEVLNNPIFIKWRKGVKPNTFGVVEGINLEDEKLLDYLMKEGVGVNYYDVREFD